MSHYKPYPAYKDSGVEWIGSVPEHWRLRKVAWDLRMTIGWTPPTGQQRFYGGQHNWVAISDLSAKRITETKTKITDAAIAEKGAKPAPAGSLLFSYKLSVGEVALLEQPAYTNEAIAAFHPAQTVAMEWWRYAAPEVLPRNGRENIYGALLLNQELMADTRFFAPDPAEQSAIAAALDRETARIDALIAKKTRFIELLKEKRQALITHAVTKGLDPNVRMKDSGVAWIGDVPEHWEVSKLAYTTREAGGKTPDTKNEAYWGGDVPWVSPKDMKQSEIIGAIDTISDTAVQECGMRLFAPGAILAVVRGMILAHSFPVATLAVPATINQDMKALEPDTRIRANYLRLILGAAKDYVVSVLVAEAAHGTRVLRTDVWRQLPALIPPLDEQDSILAELDRVATKYDKLAGKVDESIALLRERRSALITAAVTGQIDLREDAA